MIIFLSQGEVVTLLNASIHHCLSLGGEIKMELCGIDKGSLEGIVKED